MIGRWKRRGNHLATARLAVRRHLPWPARLALGLLGLIVLASGSYGLYLYGEQQGRHGALASQVGQDASRLARELQESAQRAQALEQQLRLETSTRETVSRQLVQLQADNGALREQIAFYESLLTKTDRAPALALDQFRVEPVSPGHYRLRAILVQGQSTQEAFRGEVEFRLVVERGGRRESLVWPAPRIKVNVTRYHRLERETELPPDARLKQVEIRVYADGESRAKLTRNYDVKG
ncbi:DUF6776 family protein [Chitinimonas sp. BJYL2]|uniref:DUF6776 family protein n=1 Tax=Chitinimonas sp. BJYL2 TaxID=2976696 RepID=UPI0022B44C62|nr:DUF6776 family protein [Chitinimonas sp. BJYL2]